MIRLKGELRGYVAVVILHANETRCATLGDAAGPRDSIILSVETALVTTGFSGMACFLFLHMPFVEIRGYPIYQGQFPHFLFAVCALQQQSMIDMVPPAQRSALGGTS